jgi:hypothetical protein
MLRKILSPLLIVGVITLGLTPITTSAGWPVTIIGDIPAIVHWATQFEKWANQAAQMVQQYNQLVKEYQWAQHVAQQIQNGDALTLLALVTSVSSADLTNIDSAQDLRRMLEGTITYTNQLGGMYHSVYGEALSMNNLSPSTPEDWGQAANRSIAFSQHADAAILETLAVVSKTNNATQQAKPKYDLLQSSIKDTSATPEQSTQHAALASLYAAEAVDRNNQLLAAQAAMQAQQQAQIEAGNRLALQAEQREQNYIQALIDQAPNEQDPWFQCDAAR